MFYYSLIRNKIHLTFEEFKSIKLYWYTINDQEFNMNFLLFNQN